MKKKVFRAMYGFKPVEEKKETKTEEKKEAKKTTKKKVGK